MDDQHPTPLLPCPFCGSPDNASRQYSTHFKRVRCNNCFAKGPAGEQAKAEAEWNIRAAPAAASLTGLTEQPSEAPIADLDFLLRETSDHWQTEWTDDLARAKHAVELSIWRDQLIAKLHSLVIPASISTSPGRTDMSDEAIRAAWLVGSTCARKTNEVMFSNKTHIVLRHRPHSEWVDRGSGSAKCPSFARLYAKAGLLKLFERLSRGNSTGTEGSLKTWAGRLNHKRIREECAALGIHFKE